MTGIAPLSLRELLDVRNLLGDFADGYERLDEMQIDFIQLVNSHLPDWVAISLDGQLYIDEDHIPEYEGLSWPRFFAVLPYHRLLVRYEKA